MVSYTDNSQPYLKSKYFYLYHPSQAPARSPAAMNSHFELGGFAEGVKALNLLILTLAWLALLGVGYGERPNVSSKESIGKPIMDWKAPSLCYLRQSVVSHMIHLYVPGPSIPCANHRAGSASRLRPKPYYTCSLKSCLFLIPKASKFINSS